MLLLAGFLLKGMCLDQWDGRQFEKLCYNDLQPLFGGRAIDRHVFPYVHGSLQEGQLVEGAIEYPVLTGVFMWASGLLAGDSNQYLVHSALLLAPVGVVVAYLLARLHGKRALMWAAAPALALYAFHNWDLLVVAAATLGFWAWHRGRPVWAAAAFAIGGALKGYPLFFLAPLVLERWWAKDRRGAALAAGTGVGLTVAINLPFALLNYSGWFATYEFHRARLPNWDNMWTWAAGARLGNISLPSYTPEELNRVTSFLIATAFAAALAWGWRRARVEGAYPFVPVAGAMLAAFLLFNKVHSPQYTLWLLPFFVMLSVNVGWWIGYAVADLAVYVGVFRWFHDFAEVGAEASTLAKEMMIWGVWGRAALLAGLFFVFSRARDAELLADLRPSSAGGPARPAETASHPSSNVEPEGKEETQAQRSSS